MPMDWDKVKCHSAAKEAEQRLVFPSGPRNMYSGTVLHKILENYNNLVSTYKISPFISVICSINALGEIQWQMTTPRGVSNISDASASALISGKNIAHWTMEQ